MNKNASIKLFDLNDAIDRTVVGAVHYMNHFSVKLLKRNPRPGILKGVAWETPTRVEPEFEASERLKKRIEEKQGFQCS
jgi:hypothetical protein